MAQTPRVKTPLNREVAYINKLFLGNQSSSTSPEPIPRLSERVTNTNHTNHTTNKTPTPPKRRLTIYQPMPALTQDTDIDNYPESLELERINGNSSPVKRLRDGKKYDSDYARKLTIVD